MIFNIVQLEWRRCKGIKCKQYLRLEVKSGLSLLSCKSLTSTGCLKTNQVTTEKISNLKQTRIQYVENVTVTFNVWHVKAFTILFGQPRLVKRVKQIFTNLISIDFLRKYFFILNIYLWKIYQSICIYLGHKT